MSGACKGIDSERILVTCEDTSDSMSLASRQNVANDAKMLVTHVPIQRDGLC